LLTAFAGRFLEASDDDAHRSLCWVSARRALATGSSSRGDQALTVNLVLEEMRLVVVRSDEEESSLELQGRTLEEARQTTQVCSDPHSSSPLAWPEFELPAHPVADGSPFHIDRIASARLATWFDAAEWMLAPVASREDASPLRCWPHHFDIATLISLPAARADGTVPTVGVGMTPGDAQYPAPYGYVSPWPPPWDKERPPLDRGHWHAEGWVGAVLPAAEWVSAGPNTAAAFFAHAIETSLGLAG
jgi:hypothetical protein